MVFTSSRTKQGGNILYISNRRRCNTIKSHVNSSKWNNTNTSNSANFIGNSNLPCINVQTKSYFNTLITNQKETDTESSISINDESIDENNIIQEIAFH